MPNYRIAGLAVDSDFEFLHLAPEPPGDRTAEVRVRYGSGVAPVPDIVMHRIVGPDTAARAVTIEVLPGLSFRIADGCEVEIFQGPAITAADINIFLIGTVWGVLCHQRGLLPLHCSAVGYRGRTMAFTGPSGAGKSTLAAGLGRRGHPHLSDDVMAVEFGPEALRMTPLPKGLKLCADTIAYLGVDRAGPVSSFLAGKFYVPVATTAPDPGPMASALYHLAYHDDDRPATIAPLRGLEAWQELYQSVYRVELMPRINSHAAVARQLAIVTRQLPRFRFTRPRGLDRFDAGLDVLERHMTGVAAASAATVAATVATGAPQ